MMDKVEHLLNAYSNRVNDENFVFEKIKDPNNIYFVVPSLEGTNLLFALYQIYIKQDFEKGKNLLFKAASIAAYMSDKFDIRIMDSGLNQISYALLSDNQELINRYSIMRNKINHETGIGFQLPNSIQNILLGEWEKLDRNILCLEHFVKMAKWASYRGVVNILKGFRQEDGGLIESGLKEFLSNYKKRRYGDPLIYKFISIDTSGFTKLAWMKGYEIDLKTTLVPIQLMRIKPLEHYETYDFLKD